MVSGSIQTVLIQHALKRVTVLLRENELAQCKNGCSDLQSRLNTWRLEVSEVGEKKKEDSFQTYGVKVHYVTWCMFSFLLVLDLQFQQARPVH